MPKPIIRIHDIETGEVVDREMTADEFADYKASIEAKTAEEAQKQADAEAKAALLERLGITEEEAKLLLG
jgi:hypothetical protein